MNEWQMRLKIQQPFPLSLTGGTVFYMQIFSSKTNTWHWPHTRLREPSWKELIDEAVVWCQDNSIRLSDLAEHASFRHGDSGAYLPIPEAGKMYISLIIIKSNNL